MAAIVSAAGQLLVERGYGRVSTNAIAERAGVSIGSLYQYFDDKDAIYRRLIAEHQAQGLAIIEHALVRMLDSKTDLVDELLALMRELARLHQHDPQLMRAIVGELGHLDKDDTEEAALLPRLAGLLRTRPEKQHLDMEVTAQLLIVTLDSISRWLNHLALEEAVLARYLSGVERMLRGLLGPAPTRSRRRPAH